MNFILILTLLLFTLPAFSEIDPLVWINGTIGGKFDEKEVKVTDSMGQTFMVPKSAFPKDFKFEQGAKFSIEVHEDDLKDAMKLKK